MANTTVYPYGTEGTLPSGYPIINDKYTGGADKAGSAEMIKELNEDINEFVVQDISTLTEVKAFITTNTGKWASNTNNYKCKFLAVNAGATYVVKANASRSSYIAVLKEDSHTDGTDPDYATGCSLVTITKGTYYEFTVPSDGAYLYIGTLTNNNDCTPQSVSLVIGRFVSVDEQLKIINSQRINTEGITILSGWIISSTNYWSNSGTPSSDYASICIPITPGNEYILVGGKTQRGIFAILSSDAHSNGSRPSFSSSYPGRFRVGIGECLSFIAPEDAAFIYVCLKSSGTVFGAYAAIPKTIDEQLQEIEQGGSAGGDSAVGSIAVDNIANAVGNKLYPLNPNVDSNNYVLPETIQELNVTRKADQMANVVWTPKKDVPYHTWNNPSLKFDAGTPVPGLPYSSVKELDKYIMKDVSLHTFMTAVNNPYSLLYTENVNADYSKSAWGRTYYGQNATCYFGTVCSEFSAICSGCKFDYATGYHEWLHKNHYVVKVYDQSAQGARAGDIFWKDGHCRLIYAVKKNSSGEVTHVKIAESTYGTCIINSPVTASAFNTEIKNTPCIIYRPLWLYKNNDYEASPFVAVNGETPQSFTYNDDICTFAGDKASFRVGELVVLNYNLTASPSHTWTHIQLYKGSTLLETYALADIDQSELDESQKNHALPLGTSLAYGKYKARMTDGTNYSDYTYFEVIQTNVSVSISEGVATVTASSANATKTGIKVCGVSGGARAMRELTEDEQNAATFDIDLVALNAGQTTAPIIGVSNLYLKIYFRGDYGQVTNEPVPVQFSL